MSPEGVTFNMLFVCLFTLYWVSHCVVPAMTCTTNKRIIVIPWAVKAVTVGKAPPHSLQPATQEWAGCLQWSQLLESLGTFLCYMSMGKLMFMHMRPNVHVCEFSNVCMRQWLLKNRTTHKLRTPSPIMYEALSGWGSGKVFWTSFSNYKKTRRGRPHW